MGEKRKLVLRSEYRVEVRYGNEKLEDCIEKMIEARKKNIKQEICNSRKDSV